MTKNLTSGPPVRLIIFFTLPLLIGNVFQQLYSFTDAAVVGRLLGVDALAAIGATSSMTFLLIGFTWGSSAGLAIPVAKAFGAGDLPGIRRAVTAGSLISVGIAVVITVVGSLGSRGLMELLNTPAELIDDSTNFLIVTFCGSTATVAFNFLSSVIRALGDSRTPLIFLVVSCVINAALSATFVGVFHLGVPGAAFATVVAQIISVILCFVLIAKRMPLLHVHKEDWSQAKDQLGESARIGLTMGLQTSIIAVGALVLQYAVNGLGATSLAAFTAAGRVDQVAVAPLSSFSVALSTYVAQNRGALEWHRIREGVFRTCLLAFGLAAVVGGAIIVFGSQIVTLFVGSGHADVVGLAHQYLIIQGVSYLILGQMFTLRGAIQGMGLTGIPTLSGIGELIFRTVAGLVLVANFGFIGVCFASPLAWAGALIPVAIAWVWIRKRLIAQENQDEGLRQELEDVGGCEMATCEPCLATSA